MLLHCRDHCDLDTDQSRVMYLRIQAFEERGIHLPAEKQDILKKLSKQGAALSQKFSNNIVDDEATFEYHITDETCVADLPEDVIEIAKKSAKTKQLMGYLFDADPTAYSAIMKYCNCSKIRADFERAHHQFSSSGKYDNRETILDIIQTKQKRASSRI